MNYCGSKKTVLDRRAAGTPQSRGKSRSRNEGLPKYLPLIFSVLLLPIATEADQLQERRDSYAYEQCANRCQVTLDKVLFACNTRRNTSPDSVREDCEKTAVEGYEKSMARCPKDPRREQ